jgi:uncharacterized membrane protein YeaQ/YmgE (transglycosylase-associated protein family)
MGQKQFGNFVGAFSVSNSKNFRITRGTLSHFKNSDDDIRGFTFPRHHHRHHCANILQRMSPAFWTIFIGFTAGIVARFLMPGENKPSGFVLTVLLGIAGAFVATFLGQFVGLLQPGEQAGFVGHVIGAIVVLFVWNLIARKKTSRIILKKFDP